MDLTEQQDKIRDTHKEGEDSFRSHKTPSCPPTIYHSCPVPQLNAVPDPRPVVWFCRKQSLSCLGSVCCLSTLACKVPLPLCVSLRRDLEATGPSGSVWGSDKQLPPVPNRCCWVGLVPAWSLLDQASCKDNSWLQKTATKTAKTAAKTAEIDAEITATEPQVFLPNLGYPWPA